MRSLSRRLALYVVLAVGAFALRGLADDVPELPVQDGFVVGVVMSEDGIPVAGARVVLAHVFDGIVDYVHSDVNGSFRFRDVPPGQYGVLAWSTRFGKGLAPAFVAEGRATPVMLGIKTPY